MATADDLWTGYGTVGTPAPTLTNGVMHAVCSDATNVTFRRIFDVAGGVTGRLTFFARALSGAGQAYAGFPTVSGIAGQVVIEGAEWRRYEMPIAVPATQDVGPLNIGFGFRNSQIGEIEVRGPVLQLEGGFDAAGGGAPARLTAGAQTLTLTTAGNVVASQDGVAQSDGNAFRRLQVHGVSSQSTGAHFGLWSDTSLGLVQAFTKSRGAVGEHVTVQDGDTIVAHQNRASDGTAFQISSQWVYSVGGPVSPGITPGAASLSVIDTAGEARTLIAANARGNVRLGTAKALPADTTEGFLYIPSVEGAPTGVPAETITNMRALTWDRIGKKLYVFDGGWNLV